MSQYFIDTCLVGQMPFLEPQKRKKSNERRLNVCVCVYVHSDSRIIKKFYIRGFAMTMLVK